MPSEDLGPRLLRAVLGWNAMPAQLRGVMDALCDDPAAVLAAQPVTIGHVRTWPVLMGMPLGFALLGLIIALKTGIGGSLWYWAGGGFLLGLVGIPSLAAKWRMSLTMDARGVWIRRRKEQVFCPWSVFSVGGEVFLQDSQMPPKVVLPVQSAALDGLELYRHDQVVARGRTVKTTFFRVSSHAQIEFSATFVLAPEVVGNLLLTIGSSLGRTIRPAAKIAAMASSSLATAEPDEESSVQRLSPGVLRFPMTRLSFPPNCCGCGCATTEQIEYHVPSRTVLYLHAGAYVAVQLPCCRPCRRSHLWRRVSGFLVMQIGFWLLLTLLCAFAGGNLGANALLIGGLFSLLFIKLSATYGGRWLALFRGVFYPRDNAVTFTFRRREFVDQVLAFLSPTGSETPLELAERTELTELAPIRIGDDRSRGLKIAAVIGSVALVMLLFTGVAAFAAWKLFAKPWARPVPPAPIARHEPPWQAPPLPGRPPPSLPESPANFDVVPPPVAPSPVAPPAFELPPRITSRPTSPTRPAPAAKPSANPLDLNLRYRGPAAVASSGRPVGPEADLFVGQILQAKDVGAWFAADVLELLDDGRAKVHYRGWANSWDKVVARTDLQLAPDEVSQPERASRAPATDVPVVADQPPAPPALRTWTDSTGKLKVEAELLSVTDEAVLLRRKDGREVSIPFSRLSDADQQFARQQAGASGNR